MNSSDQKHIPALQPPLDWTADGAATEGGGSTAGGEERKTLSTTRIVLLAAAMTFTYFLGVSSQRQPRLTIAEAECRLQLAV
jgi:hypothetical protein